MSKKNKIAFGTVMAVIAAVMIGFFTIQSRSNDVKLTLRNGTGFIVVSGSVEVCSETQPLKSIDPGDNQVFNFRVRGECEFKVVATFASGKTVSGKFGYLTGRLASNVTGTITTESVDGKAGE